MTCTAVSGGYDCTYTPQTALTNGSHTITVNVNDNDGNAATAGTTSFTVDTVAPALNVTAPAEGFITNKAALTVTGTATDNESIEKVEVYQNGTNKGAATINGSNWTKSITLTEGTNTIKVIATDTSGLTTEITRTVTLDTKAPVITAVTLSKTTVDASGTFTITVEVSD